MFYIEEIIDINQIFKSEIYENYLVHGWKDREDQVSFIEPK